jgi:nitrate/TMAO reductase-like tetraheme cytochrome c subunit
MLSLTFALNLQAASDNENSYQEARWDPIHFQPQINQASDDQCLACHLEIMDRRVVASSPAGVPASETLAWYQTLDTYQGEQDTFHRRHLATPYSSQLMDMKCNTCHQGNDPREETANSSATGDDKLTQRKHVDPEICLMCHGQFPYQTMGVPGPWPENAKVFGDSCLTCHAAIRTNRHQVNFLNAKVIEEAAQRNSDVCFGCHGGRAWYRISYPYPRHSWPGAAEQVPDWAKDRPTESDARFRTSQK